ncbi:MAG: hypothetical protein LBD75_07920 [Candidatus Peribacteria bacterium]|jgi:hypothetical protein|nr:hypothetical protein [Candidatus Peribacteria bacterium]
MWAGSGEPIKLTFDEYYNRFIWDYNYFLVPQIFVNEEVVSRGNTSVNLAELFP